MDKFVAHGPVVFTPDPSSPMIEDATTAHLSLSSSTEYPSVSVSSSVSSYHEAIFGSAGPYDDDGEVDADSG